MVEGSNAFAADNFSSVAASQPTPRSQIHDANACAGKPGITFICGPRNSEDLIAVPHSPWVIASGLADSNGSGGALYLIDRRDSTWRTLYPSERRSTADSSKFSSVPGSQCVEPVHFSAHGINLRKGTDKLHTVYVVNHGTRESIEIFELDTTQEPTVHWKGCLILPGTAVGNSVAPLPDGGIVVTVSNLANDMHLEEEVEGHQVTGYVLEWHAKDGWKQVPNSGGSFPNGIEVSSDGNFIFVTNTGTQDIVRLSRGPGQVQRTVIRTGIMTDNVRWDSAGQLWITGQLGGCGSEVVCAAPYAILQLDPRTLRLKQVRHSSTVPEFGAGTVALPVEDEVWLGTYRGDRIARLHLQNAR
jgi:DNA-binding beta-propeller fold protein YncE